MELLLFWRFGLVGSVPTRGGGRSGNTGQEEGLKSNITRALAQSGACTAQLKGNAAAMP